MFPQASKTHLSAKGSKKIISLVAFAVALSALALQAALPSFAGTYSGVMTLGGGQTARYRITISNDEKQVVEAGSYSSSPDNNSGSVRYPCHREGNILQISGTDQFGQKAVGTIQFGRDGNTIVLSQRVSFLFAGERYSGTFTRQVQQNVPASTGGSRVTTAADFYNRAVAKEKKGDLAGAINDYNRAIQLAK